MGDNRLGHALLSAMISASSKEQDDLWSQLSRVLGPAAVSDKELASAWEMSCRERTMQNLAGLATALAARAAQDPRLRTELLDWCSRSLAAADSELGHLNVVSAESCMQGPTVQARDVHGGIHFHPAASGQHGSLAALEQPPTPRQFPPSAAQLVGRAEDIDALAALQAGFPPTAPQLIVITGPAGVGKSALATWWLHHAAGHFPDGELYADLCGHAPPESTPPSTVLERFLRALGVSEIPTDFAERVALWRTVTSKRRLAVLLDDAFTAAQVRPLLPSGAGSVTVVTSRRHLPGLLGDGAALHPLRVLTASAAVELLARGGGQRVRQDPQAARRLATQCAHLPLAVCLAAAQLAARPGRPLSALVESLSATDPLDALQVEGEAAVRTALDQSYQLLPERAARAYRHLGLLSVSSVDRHMTAAVCATTLADADRMLDILIQTSLLEDAGRDRYAFHDLVRVHAERCGSAEQQPVQQSVRRRFVDWCLATATAAEKRLCPSHATLTRTYENPPQLPLPFECETAALAWLDEHQDMLMATVRCCSNQGWYAACWQLVDAMWPIFLRLRPAEMWVEAHSLGRDAARRAGDREGEGRMLTSGGNGLRNARRYPEACEWYNEALRYAAEDGDLLQQAQAANGLGRAHLATGDVATAREFLHQALQLREHTGYTRGVALSRLSLGEAALVDQDHQSAISHLTQAHRELAELQDPYDAARALAFLGQALVGSGEQDTGTATLHSALNEFQTTGSQHWEARTWEMLGRASEENGDGTSARWCFARARNILIRISPADAERLTGRMQEL